MAIKILECFSVSPPDDTAEQSLPFQYFDMVWLSIRLTEGLYFYSLKCSESSFLETTVAQLKHSLSLTLKHFLPLAGKIVFPLTSATAAMPLCRYAAGDSVALTITLSDADFADMTGNHCKNADEFHALVPQMPPAVYSDHGVKFSPMAIQVTLFPNQGICIGITLHHSICDATNLISFINAWASINKLNSDSHLAGRALPFYNRSHVQDATKLNAFIWAMVKTIQPTVSLADYIPLHKARATSIVSDAQIERLKNLVMIKKPSMGRVSSFTVASAYLWSCLAKSWEAAAEDEPVYLSSPVDCRPRLEPPLPENYFGNCVTLMWAYSTHGKLSGEEGFVEAVEAIAAAIGKIMKHGRGLSDYFENGSHMLSELMGKRVVWLTGSSRMDNYSADYGWGKTTKFECIHTDHIDGTVHLCKARDGGIEFGLSMPKAEMDAFAAIFNNL